MSTSRLGTFALFLAFGVLGAVILFGDNLIDRTQAEPAPDFAMEPFGRSTILGDGRVQFSEVVGQQGTPIVLNFWAADCPPCRAEMPMFQEIANEFADDVIFLGVDVGVFTGLGSREGAAQLLDELDIEYPTAFAVDGDTVRDYEVFFMPSTLFISENGNVVERVDRQISERELRERLNSIL
jgi:cytochrome c biogenesis protein CcmG, thiol:disulfide interchange protein DsbE